MCTNPFFHKEVRSIFMKTDPKISVIVPVYNASAYLENCLLSILGQSFRDIEVIAINDGSTDSSALILDHWAKADHRLLVINTAKMGVSAARNMGLANATGAYIGFVDADDWLESCMLETLYNALAAGQCDWAIGNVQIVPGGETLQTRLSLQDGYIDVAKNRPLFLEQMLQFNYDYANWNKLFSSSIIRQHHLSFDKNMCIWEDLLFNLQYLRYVNRVALVSKPLYNYRISPDSLYHKTKNHLQQFDQLYRKFMISKVEEGSKCEQEVFRKEMGRMIFYQHLDALKESKKDKNKSFISLWQDYTTELRTLDPGIFYFPGTTLSNLQGVKKKLLAKGKFKLFAFFLAMKAYRVKSGDALM